MSKCRVGPLVVIDVGGHRWKKSVKLRDGKFYWFGEWFCEYCGESTTSDVQQEALEAYKGGIIGRPSYL